MAEQVGETTGGPVTKILVANRGEIAVRVIRAAKDAGLASVAVYADPDRDAPHVRLADEAFALGGTTAAESYLNFDKLLDAAKRSGADSVHPGYGFLSENADFAQAVLDAGLTWIGPSPQAIRDLGDKVTARHIAMRAGAPLVPGTKEPVKDASEIVAFADEHGLPVAIKAAFGGGGRGLKVARTREEIPELFESATREAVAAFGRGECFVERYLDKPRHVEAQVLADMHGTAIVVGTRDCSLQRRHQKLVEEAPAPFLNDEQRKRIHESAKAICKEAGYYGAGTVEYLVATDGTISFLEVNTRLQVEHPVSEETTGLDLVREMFRIARGEKLRITEDPEPRGHSIEFRINGEDAGRGFLPAPGTVTKFVAPSGPGVRVDSGVESGSVIGGQFDSMLAKLIVTGSDRNNALERSRRALAEMVVEGMATVLPFDRVIVDDPAFIGDENGFSVHTRWIETEFDNKIEPFVAPDIEATEEEPRQNVVVEVGGRRLEVSLPGGFALEGGGGRGGGVTVKAKPRKRAGGTKAAVSGDAVTAPMQGTIVKVAVEEGQTVEAGELIVVLEAMKMENPVTAHKAGTVTGLSVEVGAAVTQGTQLLEIK
ncbi:acetyl/propionyl-CoA carboxylase, biotin carboxylase subunit fused with biotin carboxyl carrier subunit [Amycolatopsis mediterranei S699]|uniref:Biotin-dependent acyl-coenzyme A carboxylase alpha3 subunit n=2 Tax=Amycolatopsis mediterranei TaxID=33910 RepID=A0A0H3CWR7_AMYMU|nr:acetyl/propionyl/methylcrotonyl-CoA carboxylase subunit alpha [Amycolatopsis mediterranei]ADJ42753.1 acetyl/propionyl-CoA carboxylase, biotin carboxylase subunit fused with biotin carboxyl carrier subunit [Amycolatopsis mediterranei U32]AEK39444.1 acetyl/propionyl-CoA carboxylase, biotin carboxylase subunit fused with biotin carboxyl carrier subunit [Amycolatopsis mediterranei S699]AFO74467.1 acetyl/propionyl-CoA carboxylase, biotin carboxylase subunit fused with biotin carboxyl carrier subun